MPEQKQEWEDKLLDEFPLLKVQHGGRDKIVAFIRTARRQAVEEFVERVKKIAWNYDLSDREYKRFCQEITEESKKFI